jgi:trans-aconitate methyltransferase
MAREFPHCEVLGVDLAPVPLPPESLPPNCRFEMDDISLGLSHLKGQFDVVFARAIGLGLKDFRKSLADVQECLNPGGILIWIDADFDMYSGWPMVYRPFRSSANPNGSCAQRILYGKSV